MTLHTISPHIASIVAECAYCRETVECELRPYHGYPIPVCARQECRNEFDAEFGLPNGDPPTAA